MEFGTTDNDLVDEDVSDATSMEFGTTDNDLVDEDVSDATSMEFGTTDNDLVDEDVSDATSMEFGTTDNDLVDEDVSDDPSMEFGTTDNDLVDEEVLDDTSMKFDLPKNQSSVIKVIGVGGGGSNAVNHMIKQGIKGVDFVICNTDAQALDQSQALTKIQLGISLTEGLGAGEDPAVGEKSALESENEIRQILQKNTKMVFVTAGMGGGTGTGAAPVIAKLCKDLDILTIGIVTVPFGFEGPKRFKQAQDGIDKIRQYVDSLIVINNDKLVEVYGDLGLTSGFEKADEILMVAARSISEVITKHCSINIDLNDAKTILKDSGTAIMGSGKAVGPNRAEEVVKQALDSPLLNDNHIHGAKKILLLVLSGNNEITIKEIDQINHYLQREAGGDASIILGVGKDESLGEEISITIIATGVLGGNVDPATGTEVKKIHVLNSDLGVEEKNQNTPTALDNCENNNTVLEENNESEIFVNFDEASQKKTVSKVNSNKILASKNIISDNLDEISDINIKRAEERKKRLQKFHNLNFNNQVVLKELEDEPAYKRQGLELEKIEHSSSESISGVIIESKDDDLEIKNNNSFLHDNVD